MQPSHRIQPVLQSPQAVFIQEVIAAHRRIKNPVEVTYHGHLFRIYPNVFSPFIAPSGRASLSLAAWPIFHGKRVLDVGCGSGVFACLARLSGASRVVGIDINPHAVVNARENALALGVQDSVEIRRGDLFGPVSDTECFDIVFADLPFSSGEAHDDLERAFFDKNLNSISRFIRDLPTIIKHGQSPRAYLCLSNFEPVEPVLAQLPARLSHTEVLRISSDVVELFLYELQLKRRYL
jgi:methylase of polypeptide subunit release factors